GAAAYVNTEGGDDFIVVSSDPHGGGVLSNLQGHLTLDAGTGTNQLIVSESGSGQNDVMAVYDTAFVSPVQGTVISYSASGGDFSTVQLTTGVGDDGVVVVSKLPDVFYSLNSGPGNDVFDVLVTPASAYSNLVVDGSAGSDQLVATDAADAGAV